MHLSARRFGTAMRTAANRKVQLEPAIWCAEISKYQQCETASRQSLYKYRMWQWTHGYFTIGSKCRSSSWFERHLPRGMHIQAVILGKLYNVWYSGYRKYLKYLTSDVAWALTHPCKRWNKMLEPALFLQLLNYKVVQGFGRGSGSDFRTAE